MNQNHRLLVLLIAALHLTGSAWARSGQDTDGDNKTTSPAARAGKILLDRSPTSELPAWLQLRVQVRGRIESPSGTSMVNSNSDTDYLSRIRVAIGIRPVRW